MRPAFHSCSNEAFPPLSTTHPDAANTRVGWARAGKVNLHDEDRKWLIRSESVKKIVNGTTRSIRDIKALFDEIDEDKSGYLDRDEVRNLAKKMGTEMNRRHLMDAMKSMDPTGSGKVTFQMFRNWLVDTRDGRHWTDFLVLAEGQVQAIRDLAFDTPEFVELETALEDGLEVPAVLCWKRLSILLKMMGRTTSVWGSPESMYGQQSEPAVQKLRSKASKTMHIGNIEGDLEVESALEEVFTQFGRTVAATVRRRREMDEKTGKMKVSWALVSFEHSSSVRAALVGVNDLGFDLVARKLDMTQAIESMGSMGEIARQHAAKVAANTIELVNMEDIEREALARRCFFHPNAATHTLWDITMVFLLLYLMIVVPVQVGFELDVVVNSPLFWWDVFVDLYFLVDIFVNFRTAHYDERGFLEIARKRIAMKYIKGWLTIDFITCIPVAYINMLMKDENADVAPSTRTIRMLKILRLLKLTKLLRMARIVRMLERYREQWRAFMHVFGSLVWAASVFLVAHFIASMWYVVGTMNEKPNDIVSKNDEFSLL